MKKIVCIFVCIWITVACDPKEDAPVIPLVPQLSLAYISLEEGEAKEVTVSGGTPGYTAKSSSPSTVVVSITGNKVIVIGKTPGTASIVVTGADGGLSSFAVTVLTADVYKAFKADVSLRFEETGEAVVKLEDAQTLFYEDQENNILGSSKTKVGYASRDGRNFLFLEWEGGMPTGMKSGATLRTPTGVINLQSLQVLKNEGNLVWIIYKSTGSQESRIVQKY